VSVTTLSQVQYEKRLDDNEYIITSVVEGFFRNSILIKMIDDLNYDIETVVPHPNTGKDTPVRLRIRWYPRYLKNTEVSQTTYFERKATPKSEWSSARLQGWGRVQERMRKLVPIAAEVLANETEAVNALKVARLNKEVERQLNDIRWNTKDSIDHLKKALSAVDKVVSVKPSEDEHWSALMGNLSVILDSLQSTLDVNR
jgi:hypothetical protein